MNGRSALPQARWRDPMRRPGLIRNVTRGLVAAFAGTLAIFLLLEVNDTVNVQSATLVTKPRRVVHKAPYSATVDSVSVSEGERVRKTDTLLTLNAPDIASDYRSAQDRYDGMTARLGILTNRIRNTRDQLQALREQIDIQSEILQSDTLIKERSLQGLQSRLEAARAKTRLARKEFRRDSLLFEKDLLKRAAYDKSRRAWLGAKQNVDQLRSELKTTRARRTRVELDWKKQQTVLQKQVLNTRAKLLQQRQTKRELEASLRRQKNKLQASKHEYQKRIVTADVDGVVQELYDSNERTARLRTGDVLAVVAPVQDSIHARLKLEQSTVDNVSVGQSVHLKLDPYNHYKHGVVEGRIRRIEAPGGPKDSFYAVASIHAVPEGVRLKPGYEASADIIRREMPLYAYALRYIFQQFEQG